MYINDCGFKDVVCCLGTGTHTCTCMQQKEIPPLCVCGLTLCTSDYRPDFWDSKASRGMASHLPLIKCDTYKLCTISKGTYFLSCHGIVDVCWKFFTHRSSTSSPVLYDGWFVCLCTNLSSLQRRKLTNSTDLLSNM